MNAASNSNPNSGKIELVHDEKLQRFIHHMEPIDAFASYVWHDNALGDLTMVLDHIKVPQTTRGSGLGARFATQVLEHLQDSETDIKITCAFMLRVARTRPIWREKFNTGD